MADDAAIPGFVDKTNMKNLETCTGKIETSTEQLLHGADKDKVQPRKKRF